MPLWIRDVPGNPPRSTQEEARGEASPGGPCTITTPKRAKPSARQGKQLITQTGQWQLTELQAVAKGKSLPNAAAGSRYVKLRNVEVLSVARSHATTGLGKVVYCDPNVTICEPGPGGEPFDLLGGIGTDHDCHVLPPGLQASPDREP